MEYGGELTFQSMSHHEMFCSSIGFFEILKSRFRDLGGVEEGWVGVVVMMVVIIVFGIIISVIIMVVVVVVVFFGFICVVLIVVAVLQIQIPHRRGRIESSRPCFPTSQIPMIRKRFRNVRGSLRTVGTGCVGLLVVVIAAAAVQRNTCLIILNTSSTTTTHHRAPDVSLLSLIRNFQLTNRN